MNGDWEDNFTIKYVSTIDRSTETIQYDVIMNGIKTISNKITCLVERDVEALVVAQLREKGYYILDQRNRLGERDVAGT